MTLAATWRGRMRCTKKRAFTLLLLLPLTGCYHRTKIVIEPPKQMNEKCDATEWDFGAMAVPDPCDYRVQSRTP